MAMTAAHPGRFGFFAVLPMPPLIGVASPDAAHRPAPAMRGLLDRSSVYKSRHMESEATILALAALAQPTRLEAFRWLVKHEPAGVPAGEIARHLGIPHNTMSSHLNVLSRAGLVRSGRHGRSIIYRADLDRFREVMTFLLQDCCNGHPEVCAPLIDVLTPCCAPEKPMADRPCNVLFLCTGNSARSILAEGILRKDGAGRFNVYSAGSQPTGIVNPFALRVLGSLGYPTEGYRSKSWDEFAEPGAPVMDFVFTICDAAAGEACPVWPGQPMTAHWGIEDPAAVAGPEIEKERAFVQAAKFLKNRISVFLNLPLAAIDGFSLQHRLTDIGRLEGSTARNAEA